MAADFFCGGLSFVYCSKNFRYFGDHLRRYNVSAERKKQASALQIDHGLLLAGSLFLPGRLVRGGDLRDFCYAQHCFPAEGQI